MSATSAATAAAASARKQRGAPQPPPPQPPAEDGAVSSPDAEAPASSQPASQQQQQPSKQPRITKEIERLVAFNVVLDSFRTPSQRRADDEERENRRARHRVIDAPDPMVLFNMPQKKVPRKLLTRPSGVGVERIVVFVDPQNDDDDFWRPAMVVPTVEWEPHMAKVKPGHCLIRYFDSNSYGMVPARDLCIFLEDIEPFKIFAKLGATFFNDKGVKNALRLLRSSVVPNGFKWPTWDPTDTSVVEERAANKRTARPYRPSAVGAGDEPREPRSSEKDKTKRSITGTAWSSATSSPAGGPAAPSSHNHTSPSPDAPPRPLLSGGPRAAESVLDKYHDYMRARGTPVNSLPSVAKYPVSLAALLQAVTSRGGMQEVTAREQWMAVCRELDIAKPTMATSYIVRNRYLRYLYAFEVEHLKTPRSAPLLRALDRPYDVGDKVIVFHEPDGLEYGAKILEVHADESRWDFGGKYFVHYNGWNSSYDEWIPHEYVVSLHPDEMKHAKNAVRGSAGRRLSLPDVRELEDGDGASRRARSRAPSSDTKMKKESAPEEEKLASVATAKSLKRKAGGSVSGSDDNTPASARRRSVSHDDSVDDGSGETDVSWQFKRPKSGDASQTSAPVSMNLKGFRLSSPTLFYGTERSTRSKVPLHDVPFHYIPNPALDAASQDSSVARAGEDGAHGNGDKEDAGDDDNDDADDAEVGSGDDDDDDDEDSERADLRPDRRRPGKRARRSRTSRQKKRRLQERARQMLRTGGTGGIASSGSPAAGGAGGADAKPSELDSDDDGKDGGGADGAGGAAASSDTSTIEINVPAAPSKPAAPVSVPACETMEYKAAAIAFTYNIYDVFPDFDHMNLELRTKKIEARMELLRRSYKRYQARVRKCDALRHRHATAAAATAATAVASVTTNGAASSSTKAL